MNTLTDFRIVKTILDMYSRPSVIYKPSLTRELRTEIADTPYLEWVPVWKAYYGDVNAEGSTPSEAMSNFDEAWCKR